MRMEYLRVFKEKLVNEVNEEFAAHDLVSMHVPNVLEVRLKLTPIARLGREASKRRGINRR